MFWIRGPRGRRTRAFLYWTLVPLAITLIAWQPLPLEPTGGLDHSWQAGVEVAIHSGITFGNHLIFTYGPLGFLSVPGIWYYHLAELAFGYTVLIRVGLAVALFVAARRTFGVVGAFVIASIVASVDTTLGEMVLVLILAVSVIARGANRRSALLLAAGSGAFAAVEFLNKASIGISLAAMTAILVLSLPERRRECGGAAAAGAVVALVLGWALTGQSFGALPAYFQNSERIVSGYAAAMGIAYPGLAWEYTAAFVGLALGLWGAWQMTASGTPRQRWGTVGLWVAFWFFAFKEGFVRQDATHAAWFFEALLAGFIAFHWRRRHRGVALVSIGALLAFALAAQQASLTADFDPSRDVNAAFTELHTIVSPSRRAATLADGRAGILAGEPIDPQSLSVLRGHTVAVFPWEVAVVWAYGLDWDPFPVEQSYSAYTSSLDQLDANFLTSTRAPQRILIGPSQPDIDGRVLSFDQALTSRTMLCHYRPLHATTAYLVLALVSNRCSAPSLVATVHAGWDQSVPVPAPPNDHSLILVRIGGVGVAGLERVQGLLWKPAARHVILNRGAPNRLVTGTALDGLPLWASAGVDFPPPFNFAFGVRTIAVTEDGQPPTGGQRITYSFYVQSIADPAGSLAAGAGRSGRR